MNTEKIIKYSVPVFVFAIVSRAIVEISFIYYAVPVMCVVFIVLMFRGEQPSSLPVRQTGLFADEGTLTSKVSSKDKKDEDPSSEAKPSRLVYLFQLATLKVSLLLFLIPGLWFLLTSLWSPYPEVSASRALYFILISTGCMSAGVLWIRYSGKGIFDFLLPANIVIVLLCLFSLITNIPSDSWTGGHGKSLMGFFGHQNALASVILFTVPAVFFKLISIHHSNSQVSGIQYPRLRQDFGGQAESSIKNPASSIFTFTAYYLLLTANFLLLLLTYSRTSLLSLLFGVIVFLLLTKKWKIISYSLITAAVLAIIIYLTPSLNQFADKIIKKDFPEFYSSRIWMWEPSYRAALEGGIFGLGYGISHPEIRSGEYSDRFENGRLIREKGNSTLALIEETGLIGLALFLLPLIVLITNNKKLLATSYSLLPTPYFLLTATLAALLLHSQFEAWWVGVGSVQLPLFFIYLGLTINQPARQCPKSDNESINQPATG